MIIYSERIVTFIEEIKAYIKELLSKKMHLKVHGDRFYNRSQTYSYPIQVVVYNHKSLLGYFDPEFYELGFHESLMFTQREQLRNIIKHELAHYMIWISHGASIQPHGPEFRTFCLSLGWGEEVFRATTCLDDKISDITSEESAVFRKVKKLMALSTSHNAHEAESAMIKSQQLLLKHNVDTKQVSSTDEERIYLKRILKQKKENAKMRAIGRILETFFVNTVYNRSKEFIYLEITGSAVNLEIAEYVASILDQELERLWESAKGRGLKGIVAKNSFFLGLAKGYCNKVQALKREYDVKTTRSLMVIDKQLIDSKELVYKRLRTSRSQGSLCQSSSALGEQMGKQLTINPALREGSKESALAIRHQVS